MSLLKERKKDNEIQGTKGWKETVYFYFFPNIIRTTLSVDKMEDSPSGETIKQDLTLNDLLKFGFGKNPVVLIYSCS